jgi:hypothetical protein
MKMMYKFEKRNLVINLYGIEYYMYTHINDNIRLTIYLCSKDPVVVDLSEEEFNDFEDTIKLNIGFFSKRKEKKKK